jgi:hypothetical protein
MSVGSSDGRIDSPMTGGRDLEYDMLLTSLDFAGCCRVIFPTPRSYTILPGMAPEGICCFVEVMLLIMILLRFLVRCLTVQHLIGLYRNY